MANPTKFSRPSVKPAVESRAFCNGTDGMQTFIDEKVAQGFRVQVTKRFNGRDWKTKQPVKVPVVHVFEK